MIFHKCGSTVHLDITDAFRILSSPSISDTGVVVGQCEFLYSEKEPEVKYYCSNCKTTCSSSDLYMVCSECGIRISMNESFKLKGSGGIYCKAHAEYYSTRVSSSGTMTKRTIRNVSEIQSIRIQR